MKLVDYTLSGSSRKDKYTLYPIGDIHLGNIGCHEKGLIKLIKEIKNDPNAIFFLGGDLCDCVVPSDAKRFDFNTLPEWMFVGEHSAIKERLCDIATAQRDRCVELFEPIADKCIGAIMGNHEYALSKYHNRDFHSDICSSLNITDLTDCCIVRLKFKRGGRAKVITFYACHGNGGGRTAGSEPNHLDKLARNWDVDMVFRGHSHTFCIAPPTVMGYVPQSGALPDELLQKAKLCANWGTFLKSYAQGPSTYTSRANYPMRPMCTVKVELAPHKDCKEIDKIVMSQINLS